MPPDTDKQKVGSTQEIDDTDPQSPAVARQPSELSAKASPSESTAAQ